MLAEGRQVGHGPQFFGHATSTSVGFQATRDLGHRSLVAPPSCRFVTQSPHTSDSAGSESGPMKKAPADSGRSAAGRRDA